MEKLTVLYDAWCGFCVSCRRWLEAQPAYIPIEFIPAGSAAARETFPDLDTTQNPSELIVVGSDGAVYRGAHAWIMCLYALREYREWAQFLSRPTLLPLARQAFEMLSRNRKEISDQLGLLPEPELVDRLRRLPVSCETSHMVPDPTLASDRRAGGRVILAILLIILGTLVLTRGAEIVQFIESDTFRIAPSRQLVAGSVSSVLGSANQEPGPGSQKEVPMEYILWTYGIYLAVSIALTIWVARTLHKNGRVFLVETFAGQEALADSVNHLLVVGFYLINIGYVALALKETHKPADAPASLEMLSSKVGLVLLVLGGMHFFNLYVFSRLRKRAQLRHLPPPVRPQGAVPPPPPVRPPNSAPPLAQSRPVRPTLDGASGVKA